METRQSRQPTESRQSEIVATLVRLSAEHSSTEITTADIAKAMNLTQGALFRHFPTKEAIRLAVVAWIEDNLLGRVDQARRQAASSLQALEAMFLAHVTFVMEHPGAPRLVFGELQQPADSPLKQGVSRLIQRYHALLGEVLDAAAREGALRPGLDRAAAAALFLGAIQGLVMQAMLLGSTDRLIDQARGVFALYRHGLEARP